MSSDSGQPDRHHQFTIYESELRVLAGVSASWGDVEAGGDLSGLLSHGGHAVVLLALPPGPNARHEALHFAQDLAHFRRIANIIDRRFGLQIVGGHHSHHSLGIDQPSGGDVAQVRSITSKNNIRRWVEVITTHHPVAPEGPGRGRCTRGRRKARQGDSCKDGVNIRINSFSYPHAPSGRYCRCPIRVIKGISPIRQALASEAVFSPEELGAAFCDFPLERISFDDVDSRTRDCAAEVCLPGEIQEQLEELPSDVAELVRVRLEDHLIVIVLPLDGDTRALVAYHRRRPHRIRFVFLSGATGGPPEDVTHEILDEGTTARLVCVRQCILSLYHGHDSGASMVETDSQLHCPRSTLPKIASRRGRPRSKQLVPEEE
ncbi:MAG: hypothetical protein KAY37_05580 [Phycisphaerae bacterium]|nr:hypothetical protein [Phycisphaerae bacterium]